MPAYAIPISSRSALRVTRALYCGQSRVDVRVWYLDDAGEWRPTRRGVVIPIADGEAFLGAVRAKLEQEEPD